MSFSTVYRWFTKFSSGQESVEGVSYLGRPRSAVIKSNINNLIRSSPLLRNMRASLSDSWHK